MNRTVKRPRRSTLAGFAGLAIACLAAAPVSAYQVCWDQYSGNCLDMVTCDHYDADGNWVGRVRIDYQC